jgi:hypothetical protein
MVRSSEETTRAASNWDASKEDIMLFSFWLTKASREVDQLWEPGRRDEKSEQTFETSLLKSSLHCTFRSVSFWELSATRFNLHNRERYAQRRKGQEGGKRASLRLEGHAQQRILSRVSWL